MRRRTVPLTRAEIELLPAACRRCLFWEEGSLQPALPRTVRPSDEPPEERKAAWVSTRVQAGAPPGRVVFVDDEVAGYALFAPAGAFASRSSLLPRISPDALELATVWVSAAQRGAGLGRLLLQAALKDALRLDLAAVEAYGDRRWCERSCVLPATWLLHEGFEVHHEHPRTPVLRLETRRLVRWAGSLEQALEEVLGRIPRLAGEAGPGRVPVPNAARGTEQVSRRRDTSG